MQAKRTRLGECSNNASQACRQENQRELLSSNTSGAARVSRHMHPKKAGPRWLLTAVWLTGLLAVRPGGN
jgi:hypothetical protein